jgi:hypothetical protein
MTPCHDRRSSARSVHRIRSDDHQGLVNTLRQYCLCEPFLTVPPAVPPDFRGRGMPSSCPGIGRIQFEFTK